MERIYINRECCVAYVVLALNSIYHSANKERTIEDLLEEIKVMFKLYPEETKLMDMMEKIIAKEGKYKVKVIRQKRK